MSAEEWRMVRGYEGLYSVSNLGRVRSLARTVERGAGTQAVNERILRPGLDGQGYHMVRLAMAGVGRTVNVHRLVADAFLGPRPPKSEIAHNDGDRFNNRSDNLRYATHAENLADKLVHGTDNRGSRHGRSVLTEDQVRQIKALRGLQSGKSLAAMFGVSRQIVCDIHKGRRWAHIEASQ
jgi:hypothetical protein